MPKKPEELGDEYRKKEKEIVLEVLPDSAFRAKTLETIKTA